MATYLADTNLLLRLADTSSSQHLIATESLIQLINRGDEVFLTPQNFMEFWAVATRPVVANGFGWDCERTAREVAELQMRFPMLDDSPEIFSRWLELVKQFSISGKRVHDARLVAVLLVHSIDNLITFNIADFVAFPMIALADPRLLVLPSGK